MVYDNIPKEEYSNILEKMPICCVDLVIHKDKKVLLILRKKQPSKGEWWVQGGRIQKNESLENAAKRKAYEETGLDVRIEKRIGVYEFLSDKGPFEDLKTGIHDIIVVFLAKPLINQEISVDENHQDFKWINQIEEDLHPYIKQLLKDSKIFG